MECAKEPDAITAKSLPQVGSCALACEPHREGKLGRQPWLGAGEEGVVPLPLASLQSSGKVGSERAERTQAFLYTQKYQISRYL